MEGEGHQVLPSSSWRLLTDMFPEMVQKTLLSIFVAALLVGAWHLLAPESWCWLFGSSRGGLYIFDLLGLLNFVVYRAAESGDWED